MEKFELGPRQESWLKFLENAPEHQQMGGSLGVINTDEELGIEFKACCLGAACYILHGKRVFDDEGILVSSLLGSENILLLNSGDVELMGLHSRSGDMYNEDNVINLLDLVVLSGKEEKILKMFSNSMWNKVKYCTNLAALNDQHMPWKDIAKIIRDYPQIFFKESK